VLLQCTKLNGMLTVNKDGRRVAFTVGYSKFEMNTPAVCRHAFIYDDAGNRQSVAMQQLSAKVFRLSFQYLHSLKSGSTIWPNANSLFGLLSEAKVNTKRIFGTALVITILPTALSSMDSLCHFCCSLLC